MTYNIKLSRTASAVVKSSGEILIAGFLLVVLNQEPTERFPPGNRGGKTMENQLVLASSSPRRQELFKQVKIPFTIRVAEIDESKITTTNPENKVTKLATLKGRAVPIHDEREVILAADTIVAYKGKILGKPKTKTEAKNMISSLSGEIHDVFTGVMIRSKKMEKTFVSRTKVEFWALKSEEIAAYIETDEPYDKAGGYGIQSLGSVFVKQIIGDYYNVMGLPLSKVFRELKTFGVYSSLR